MTTTLGVTQTYYGQPVNIGTSFNIDATTTGVQVKTGSGALYKVILNNPAATGVITLYDGTSTSGKVLAAITVPASPQPVSLEYNVHFATGLFLVVATAAQNLTISFK